jgi:hypothetical protein
MQKMSDIEKYYAAIITKWPTPMPPWNDLAPQRQMMFIQSFNLLIQALS